MLLWASDSKSKEATTAKSISRVRIKNDTKYGKSCRKFLNTFQIMILLMRSTTIMAIVALVSAFAAAGLVTTLSLSTLAHASSDVVHNTRNGEINHGSVFNHPPQPNSNGNVIATVNPRKCC